MSRASPARRWRFRASTRAPSCNAEQFGCSGVPQALWNSRTLEQPNGRTLFPSIWEDCLTSPRYLAAYYFWYFAAIGVYEPYLTPFWRHLGFPSAQLGLLNSISPGIAAFVPFLWTAYADATRQGERIFLINTWVSALVALLLIQLTHALTFGVFYLAAVQTVDALVPDGPRATAQGVFASVTFGLGGLVGNTLGGLLYEPLGMAWLYAAAALLATAATALYWTGTRHPVAAGRVTTTPIAGRLPGGKSR